MIERMLLDLRLRFLRLSRLQVLIPKCYTWQLFYIHTHSHVEDREGTPGKSPLRSAISRCFLLGVPSIPLHIQRKLWKSRSDSSQ